MKRIKAFAGWFYENGPALFAAVFALIWVFTMVRFALADTVPTNAPPGFTKSLVPPSGTLSASTTQFPPLPGGSHHAYPVTGLAYYSIGMDHAKIVIDEAFATNYVEIQACGRILKIWANGAIDETAWLKVK